MPRKLSVRARVGALIKTRLEAITVANGYNTTVANVSWARGLPTDVARVPELRLVWGEAEYEYRSDAEVWEHASLAVIFSTTATEDLAEYEYEMLRADIQTALLTSGLTELFITSGSTTRLVWCTPMEDSPVFTDGSGTNVNIGVVTFQVTFSRMISNPHKTDVNDTEVTE